MSRWWRTALPFVVVASGACGDEDPTTVGAPLFPEGLVRTVEVVLEAPEFLVSDTSFAGTRDALATSLVLGTGVEGSLDAHVLTRFLPAPTTVRYRDASGTEQTDSTPSFFGGELSLRLDSAALGAGPATIRAYTLAEPWDPVSVGWELRVDTAGAELAWAVPGGTPEREIASATWTVGTDTLLFPLDSTTVASLDSAALARGVVFIAETPGVRLHATGTGLRLLAHPSARPDTVVHATVSTGATRFVYTPALDATSALRIGGVPGWRSVVELREGLHTLTFPCPAPAAAGCTLSAADATVTSAELLLQPLPPPPGFRPADSVQVELRGVVRSPLVPLTRAPLTDIVSGLRTTIAPERWAPPVSEDRIGFDLTPLMTQLLAPESETTTRPSSTVALLVPSFPERFGVLSFASQAAGAAAPRLRLVLTVSEEVLAR